MISAAADTTVSFSARWQQQLGALQRGVNEQPIEFIQLLIEIHNRTSPAAVFNSNRGGGVGLAGTATNRWPRCSSRC